MAIKMGSAWTVDAVALKISIGRRIKIRSLNKVKTCDDSDLLILGFIAFRSLLCLNITKTFPIKPSKKEKV
jgi:hypothetical protein